LFVAFIERKGEGEGHEDEDELAVVLLPNLISNL
jgi:hypothetical protein